MTALPETPAHQKPISDPADGSRPDDRSDDESEPQLNPHADDDSPTKHEDENEKHQDQDAHYAEEANTDYSLFANPGRLATVRQELFDLRHEIDMPAADWDEFFPFVDNVWRKFKLDPKDHEQGFDTFCCRLRPSNQAKSATPKAPIEGKQQRRKRKREEKTCPMLMRVTYTSTPTKRVKISRAVPPDVTHSHDLDYMDQNKRNSAIMDVARREACRGFLPGSIFWKMQEEADSMNAAGGKFMKVSDVRNVQYPWRQLNTAVLLKAHSGYSQQRTGPRQPRAITANSATSTPQNTVARPNKSLQHFTPQPPYPQYAQKPLPPSQSLDPSPVTHPKPNPSPHPPGTIHYPEGGKDFLQPYLPYVPRIASTARPHITLTWAASLDSRIALLPGVQTAISSPETKAMTHFLRSQHDAILIGVKTALADNPGLNCRLAGAGGYGGQDRALQPRPIIIDPHARLHLHPDMRLLKAAADGKALGPWIVVGPGKLHPASVTMLKAHGGEFLQINEIHPDHGLDWEALFAIFHREGIKSLMVEGGGKVLSELLKPRYTHCIDSVIVTIAPTFLGKSGVEVSPETTFVEGQQPLQTRLINVKWQPFGQSDVVLCGQMDHTRPRLPGIHEFNRQANSAPGPPGGAEPTVPFHQPPPAHYAPPPQPSSFPPPRVLPPHIPHSPAAIQSTNPTTRSTISLPPPPQLNGTIAAPHPLQRPSHSPPRGPPTNGSPRFRHYGPPGTSHHR